MILPSMILPVSVRAFSIFWKEGHEAGPELE
jgi:hypothetical protein